MAIRAQSMQHPTHFQVGPQGGTEVIFGVPWAEALPAALRERARRRVMVLSSSGRRGPAESIVAALRAAGLSAELFAEAEQHVPEALAERAGAVARRQGADALVAVGGGSVIGLAKAILLRWPRALEGTEPELERPLFAALPTTYAGSEMTQIWGLSPTGGERKEVGRDPRVRADLVVYDPALSSSLPAKLAIPSLFNAMAHSVDALYPLERSERAQARELAELAGRSVAELARAAEAIAEGGEGEARGRLDALAGSQKAGEILDRAGMSLQHALAHVLGGGFGLDHAAVHTILLPHVVAFMAPHAPVATRRLAEALGVPDPAAALDELQRQVGAPTQLRELGWGIEDFEGALARALELLADKQVESPRPLDADDRAGAVAELLRDAWLGRRPSVRARRLPAPALKHRTHAHLRPALAGAPLESARAAVLCVHGRGSTAEEMIAKFEGLVPELDAAAEGLAIVAVQASGRSWYSHGFAGPIADNQPALDSALELLAATRDALAAQLRPDKTLLFGFSQGACLLVDHFARVGGRAAGVVAIAGALIGERPVAPWHRAELERVPVVLGVADEDSWVPRARVEAAADHLESHGALVQRLWAPGKDHTVTEAQAQALRALVRSALAR